MRVPPNHPFTDGICHYKPSIWGYPHDLGTPHDEFFSSPSFLWDDLCGSTLVVFQQLQWLRNHRWIGWRGGDHPTIWHPYPIIHRVSTILRWWPTASPGFKMHSALEMGSLVSETPRFTGIGYGGNAGWTWRDVYGDKLDIHGIFWELTVIWWGFVVINRNLIIQELGYSWGYSLVIKHGSWKVSIKWTI